MKPFFETIEEALARRAAEKAQKEQDEKSSARIRYIAALRTSKGDADKVIEAMTLIGASDFQADSAVVKQLDAYRDLHGQVAKLTREHEAAANNYKSIQEQCEAMLETAGQKLGDAHKAFIEAGGACTKATKLARANSHLLGRVVEVSSTDFPILPGDR